MNCIKEYQINKAGDTSGIIGAIPTNHRLCIVAAYVYNNGTKWGLRMTLLTYKDDSYSETIKNDNFKTNEVIVDLGDTVPASGLKTLIKNAMSPILNDLNNVGSGNYTEDPA